MPHSNIDPKTRTRARRLRRELDGPDYVFVTIEQHVSPFLKKGVSP
jgi:hypothetical protein